MGWAVGYDSFWERDIGYGVPAICDYPDCNREIHRGLSYVCGNEPYGGEKGCGLFFCRGHLNGENLCKCCANKFRLSFKAKPDVKKWIKFKLEDKSWEEWRKANPEKVLEMRNLISEKV